MKRFLLFAGDMESPRGGWGDFVGSYETQPEALDAVSEMMSRTGLDVCNIPDWWHIVDSESGNIVQDGNRSQFSAARTEQN